jgi:hypothetical protein
MFGPNGNPTANNLLEIVAYSQQVEGAPFEVRAVGRSESRPRKPEFVRTDSSSRDRRHSQGRNLSVKVKDEVKLEFQISLVE